MNEQCPDASDLGGLENAKYRVSQLTFADALSLVSLIGRQTAKDHHRNGIGHVSLKSFRRIAAIHRTIGEAVISNHR